MKPIPSILPSVLPPALLGAILILGSPFRAQALQTPDPWEGAFQGDGLTLVLRAAGGGAYEGEAREGIFRFTVEGRVSGGALEGSYALWGTRSPFRAELDGDRMTVNADGDIYVLAREGTAGLPASGAVLSTPPAADEVDDPAWGLRFRIPTGWQLAQQDEESWVLGSTSLPGLVLVWELELGTLAELRAVVSQEIVDDGIRLSPRGSAQEVGQDALGVEVEGTLGDAQVRGYAVGVISPHGPGVTILAVTEPERYEEGHRRAARELAESVRFRPPPVFGDQAWWQSTLTGQRLARLTRTSSAGAGGSTSRTVVTLCRDGRAGYLYTYQMSMSVPGVSASDSSRDEGEGRWEVVQRGGGHVLVMALNDGRVLEWSLSYQNDRIHLDGREFLRDEPVC
ncbi:MAG: hypothetical protein EA422_15025 [Gemmatimonadales bacterium]|nr:MAG: hypothetical protein EA422_15025 [Gemmatimonadales bacterium]